MSTPPGSRGEGRRDPETGGRPLADILREAGVESPTRGRRRRGDELEDTGVGFPGPEHHIAERAGAMKLAMGALALLAIFAPSALLVVAALALTVATTTAWALWPAARTPRATRS